MRMMWCVYVYVCVCVCVRVCVCMSTSVCVKTASVIISVTGETTARKLMKIMFTWLKEINQQRKGEYIAWSLPHTSATLISVIPSPGVITTKFS